MKKGQNPILTSLRDMLRIEISDMSIRFQFTDSEAFRPTEPGNSPGIGYPPRLSDDFK